jgi:hypothetical protein
MAFSRNARHSQARRPGQQRGRLEARMARSIAVVQLLLLPVVLCVPEQRQGQRRERAHARSVS